MGRMVGGIQADGLDGEASGTGGDLGTELAGLVGVPVGQVGRGLAHDAAQRVLGLGKNLRLQLTKVGI